MVPRLRNGNPFVLLVLGGNRGEVSPVTSLCRIGDNGGILFPEPHEVRMFRRCYSTAAAAAYLGVDPQTLAAWRRRGIGPAYARFPTGFGRNSASKAGGVIVYPIDSLAAFMDRLTVPAGRLPHPSAGRPRGSGTRPKTPAVIPERK